MRTERTRPLRAAAGRSRRRYGLLVLALVAGCGGDPDGAAQPSSDGASATSDVVATTEPSTSASTDAPAGPFDGDQSWIAYYGLNGTRLVHPDGSDDHELDVQFGGQLVLANWSPDGRRLVMTAREVEGAEPIYEYDLDTTELRQPWACEDPSLGDDEPVYSPDGSRVLFIRALGPVVDDLPNDCGLWLGDPATGTVEQLTSNIGCSQRETFAHWSPDGTRLVYYRGVYDHGVPTANAVYVLDVASGEERQLTADSMFGGDADWSPDGEWIVFSTYPLNDFQCCQVSNLFRIRPDGSGLEQLTEFTTDGKRATQPRYTPDGEWIIYTSVTEASRGLWVMPVDGGEPVEIAAGGIHTHGTWQPQPG